MRRQLTVFLGVFTALAVCSTGTAGVARDTGTEPAVISPMIEASPQGSTDVPVERGLKSFTLKVWVEWGYTNDEETLKRTAYYEDSDVRSMNLTWQASYKHEGRTSITDYCAGTISASGSGSGTGHFAKWDASEDVSGYGVPTNQRWTALAPTSTSDGYRVRGQITGCGRDASIDRTESPTAKYTAPVLLPGTVAELAALPTGTRINREYSFRDRTTLSFTPVTVRYEAVKNAVPPLPVFVRAPSGGWVQDDTPILIGRAAIFGDEPYPKTATTLYNVKAGVYTITVTDQTKRHNFHLVGPGINIRTPVAGTGTLKFRVRFRPGKIFLYSDRAPAKRRTITVVS
jgi:hypothetical protein